MSHWLLAPLTVLLLTSCALTYADPAEMRGIWMHSTQIKTREQADRCIAAIDNTNLNAVFLLVWYWGGQAFYHSQLCPMGEGVEEGHDPLGYMIQECHKRGVEVHAWFVNGAYGAAETRHVLDLHPGWAVDTGGSGELWYDFGKPEVRTFQSDLMIECLKNYDVDGIHFDYIGYGPHACYCEHCQQEFATRYDYEPITGQSAASFPIVAPVSANPVAGPTTATVLARFSNDIPAIAINELGEGNVLLVNWHAERETPPAVSETVRRVLARWGAADDPACVMDTAPNRERYGSAYTAATVTWLRKRGYQASAIQEEGLAGLGAGSTLVLSAVYLIPDETAAQIEAFVRAGGTLLVIDGPVFAIKNNASIQRVLGMSTTAGYFSEVVAIHATAESDLLPTSDRQIDLEQERLRDEKWAEYRKWGVTELVRDVYARAKALKPDALVTAAVFTPLASADNALQDWPGWLREGIVDYVIPMAYTMSNDDLATQIEEWKTLDPDLERIVPGLSLFRRTDHGESSREPDLVLSQHQLCMDRGARGNAYFALTHLNKPLTNAFTAGPYRRRAQAYRPPSRKLE